MKNFYEMVNKDKSIRTNYNNQYKRRLKRVNSKPNISRTYKIFNEQLKNKEQDKSMNNVIYDENQAQNHEKNNIYKEYPKYNQSEETCSSLYQESEYSYNSNFYKNKNTKRVIDSNYQEPPIYKKQLNNYCKPKEEWAEMLYHPTKNKNLASKIINSKTYESNVFPKNDDQPLDKLRHIKETKYSDRLHKTQITTLPGCIKRGKYDIKDDKFYGMKNTESYLYKVEHDYNSNVLFGPLSKEEEKVENYFPVEQRYHGSYQRGVKDNDIFNLKDEEEEENNFIPGKKLFKDNKTFKSQIMFA